MFLAGCSAVASRARAERGEMFGDERRRYADPSTEFEVLRLTDPTHTSYLPGYPCRPVSRRGSFLLYASDRTGTQQAYRMELRGGESKLLSEAEALDPATLTLMPDERSCCYVDGRRLVSVHLGSLRTREIYRLPEGVEWGSGFAVSGDGVHAAVVERQGSVNRIRLVSLGREGAATVVERGVPLADPVPRPKRAGILYRREGGLWLVNYDGQQDRPLKLAVGGIGPAVWSPDGKTVIYLHFPEDRGRLNTLREHTPDSNTDTELAPTSQFVSFGVNGDASVFVGASGSKASPHVLLLLRVTRRELTLCEHKASDARRVSPAFAPGSQRIFFESDRHGKPAIYTMTVDRLVEKTES